MPFHVNPQRGSLHLMKPTKGLINVLCLRIIKLDNSHKCDMVDVGFIIDHQGPYGQNSHCFATPTWRHHICLSNIALKGVASSIFIYKLCRPLDYQGPHELVPSPRTSYFPIIQPVNLLKLVFRIGLQGLSHLIDKLCILVCENVH